MSTSSIDDPDPRRQLEVTVAYLRLGCREGGIALDVKGGHAKTPQLQALVGRGDLTIMRPDRSTKRLVPRVFTSPTGIDRLADYDIRYGETFGPEETIPMLKADKARR